MWWSLRERRCILTLWLWSVCISGEWHASQQFGGNKIQDPTSYFHSTKFICEQIFFCQNDLCYACLWSNTFLIAFQKLYSWICRDSVVGLGSNNTMVGSSVCLQICLHFSFLSPVCLLLHGGKFTIFCSRKKVGILFTSLPWFLWLWE